MKVNEILENVVKIETVFAANEVGEKDELSVKNEGQVIWAKMNIHILLGESWNSEMNQIQVPVIVSGNTRSNL